MQRTTPMLSPSYLDTAAGELSERLEQEREDNNRVPQLLTVNLASSLPWTTSKNGGVQAALGEHGRRAGSALQCRSPATLSDSSSASMWVP